MNPKLKAIIDEYVGGRYANRYTPRTAVRLVGHPPTEPKPEPKAQQKPKEKLRQPFGGQEYANGSGTRQQVHPAIQTQYPVLTEPPAPQQQTEQVQHKEPAAEPATSKKASLAEIIKKGCEFAKYSEQEIIHGKGRSRPVARVRQAIAYVMAVHINGKRGAQGIIAKALDCDRTTARHSIIKIAELRRDSVWHEDDHAALNLIKQLSEHFNIPLPDPKGTMPTFDAS